MFFREIIAAYCENHMELSGQNSEIFNVEADGTFTAAF